MGHVYKIRSSQVWIDVCTPGLSDRARVRQGKARFMDNRVLFKERLRSLSHELVQEPTFHAMSLTASPYRASHYDVTEWKHFPRHWPSVWVIYRSPANSPHKGQWRGALMFSLICASNKRLSKQSWGWWFETPSRSLWHHCNVFA